MKITKRTLYKDCYYFARKEHVDAVKKAVRPEDLEGYETLLALSLGQFLSLIKGNENLIKELFFSELDFTFWDFCKRLKWLDNEVLKITKIFDSLKVSSKPEEKKAAANVEFLPFHLEIRAFAIDRFHLKSFDEADKCRLSDVLVLKKREAANSKYERNLREIYAVKK